VTPTAGLALAGGHMLTGVPVLTGGHVLTAALVG